MLQVDTLYNQFHSRQVDGVKVKNAVKQFISATDKIQNGTDVIVKENCQKMDTKISVGRSDRTEYLTLMKFTFGSLQKHKQDFNLQIILMLPDFYSLLISPSIQSHSQIVFWTWL
jgi:hypothetical protein